MKRTAGLVLMVLASLCIQAKKSPPAVPAYLAAPAEALASPASRRVALGLFGHFDDDSTIAGTMNLMMRNGWEVHIAWITTAGGVGGIYGEPEERIAEARLAAAAVGIPPERQHYLGFPDHGAVDHLPEAVDKVTELVKEVRPSLVITCAYEGGHTDHDATPLAAYVASKRVDFKFAHFEVPTYNTSGPKIMPYRMNQFIKAWGKWEYVRLDRQGYKVRKEVRRHCYKSQWFFMVPEGLIGGWRHLTGKGEPIRALPNYDFTQPPHPGKLLWQRGPGIKTGESFDYWRNAVLKLPEFQAKD
jgi:LmbE family N-acetylglucosaminyl deacetylase